VDQNHGGFADYRRAVRPAWRCLNVLPAPSLASNIFFAFFEIDANLNSFFTRLDARNRFDKTKVVNVLCVVGDGAVGIDGNRDRAMALKTECDSAEPTPGGAIISGPALLPRVLHARNHVAGAASE